MLLNLLSCYFVGAVAYVVEVTRTDVIGDVISIRVTSVSAVVESLVPGATYSIRVFSVGIEIRNDVGSPAVTRQTG